MSVTAKNLIPAKYAASSASTEYTSPDNTRTIIDKFTATNTTGGAVTVTVHIVPQGESVEVSNKIISAISIAAGVTTDITQLQNQILNAGDYIAALAGAGTSIVIRASGREVTL